MIPTPQEVADAAANAAEKVADESIDHLGADAPGFFEKCLDALAKFEVVGEFKLGLHRKE